MNNQALNRFVSTLAGAFRSFYIYNQDNKAFDEIMQNLAKRFQDVKSESTPIDLSITNRSLLYGGEVVGFQEIVVPLAALLRNLGYKNIRFQAPLQTRHFFQLLHILTGKDSNDGKNEKLFSLIDDGEPKPISLVPITANSYLLRLSDEAILHRLAPLSVSKTQGGPGLLEKISAFNLPNLPDTFACILYHTTSLQGSLKAFVQNLITATQEGYFPCERFLSLFPLPESLRQELKRGLAVPGAKPLRAPNPLGHGFKSVRISRFSSTTKVNRLSMLSAFSAEEIQLHQSFRASGALPSMSQDLDLAGALLKESGPNFTLGLSLLLRSMGDKNPVGIQEKALKIGVDVWISSMASGSQETVNSLSLLSSLRHQLVSINNISLVVFPIRNVTIESSLFADMGRYLLSLGKVCVPALIEILGAEQDRSMRKKLCQLITLVAREDGVDLLCEAIPKASPFLLRNLIMILGDLRVSQAVPSLIPLTNHSQKIVRSETIRTLCKIGTDDASRALVAFARQTSDADLKQVALIHLSKTSFQNVIKDLLGKTAA